MRSVLTTIRRFRSPVLALVSACCLTDGAVAPGPGAASGARGEEGTGGQASSTPSSVLTLEEAVSRALSGSPGLAAARLEVRAAEARQAQAAVRPNPELEFELENIGDTEEASGLEAAESTLVVSQVLELGRKRPRRARVAGLELRLATWDLEAERLDTVAATERAFLQVLVAQERLELLSEAHELGRRLVDTVVERVRAGKASPLERTKAGVEMARRDAELSRTRRELAGARAALAAVWGMDEPDFERVQGDLHSLDAMPSLAQLREALPGAPETARLQDEAELRRAELASAEADSVPDLEVSAGVRRDEGADEHTFLIAVSVPLPFFDRNRNGVAAARASVARAQEEGRGALASAKSTLTVQFEALAAAREEVETLSERVLPGAREAYEATREGYEQGKYAYLDIIDAQQTLIDVRADILDALAAYHEARLDVRRLTGAVNADGKRQEDDTDDR